MAGITKASCSCEFNSSDRCICTVKGEAKVTYAGCYSIMRCWLSGGYRHCDELYNTDIAEGASATFDYEGSFDNSNPEASDYDIALVLLKADGTGTETVGTEKVIYPETCEEEETDAILSVRAYDADTDAYLYGAWVYINNVYNGLTLGSSPKLFTVDPGFKTIKLTKDGYSSKIINTGYVNAGTTLSVDGGMDPEDQLAHVNVTTVDAWSDTSITGAEIYVGNTSTGKTTPCTLDLDPSGVFGYEFLAKKEHFSTPAKSYVVNAGETYDLELRMQALGMQCDISLGSIGAPDVFPPPPLPTGLPSPFKFTIPFSSGSFTYYGIGWVASILHSPSAVDVINAFAKSLVVTVNGVNVSPTYVKSTGTVSFDLLDAVNTLLTNGSIAADATQLTIKITHATRMWFDTSGYENAEALGTTTETITINMQALSPLICLPTISYTELPGPIPLTPVPGGLPTIDVESLDPIKLVAAMTCTQGGETMPSAFPLTTVFYIEGAKAATLTAGNGSNTIGSSLLGSYIISAIIAKLITTDMSEFSIELIYPSKIEDGVVTAYAHATETISLSSAPTPSRICIPSISDLVVQDAIQLTPVPGGLPTFNSTGIDPLTFVVSMDCTEGGETVANTYPIYIIISIAGSKVGNIIASGGSNTLAASFLSQYISSVITAKLITPDMSGFPIELTYPSRIEDGVVTEYATITETIAISALTPGSLLCDISVYADVPLTIPFNIPTPGALPVPGVASMPVTVRFTPWCEGDGDEPANLLTFITANVYLNDVSFGTITPNNQGYATFDLSSNTNWLSTINPGDTSMELKITFPEQLQCSTPTPIGTDTYTKSIGLSFTGSDIPDVPYIPDVECVLTAADYFTCPDGTVIQLNECLNGVKVPTGTICPVTPPGPVECVLTAADYFTCPDGTVIQLNECLNGVKVPTGTICPVTPPGPVECVLTNLDYMMCPDGSIIQLNECVTGVKVPITPIPSCYEQPVPEPEPDIECTLTNADYFTCPDGTVIQLNECVNGVKVPTGATCPPAEIREKTVYVTTPMVTRVGKRISVVAFVRCGTDKSGGEPAWVTANGELITTTNTSNGEVAVSWTPIVAGLYSICVTVPASGQCGTGASSCTYVRVVSELSPDEIAAAEEEFERIKEQIGEVMERI